MLYKWKKKKIKCPTLFIYVGQPVAESVLVKAGLSTEREALRLQYSSPLKQGTFKEGTLGVLLCAFLYFSNLKKKKKKKDHN